MNIPDEYWTTEVPEDPAFDYVIRWPTSGTISYMPGHLAVRCNQVQPPLRFCRLALAAEVDRLKAENEFLSERVKGFEALADYSREFIAYMQSELAAMPCLHAGTQHSGDPPMMWPEKIKCIVARAVQDVKAENERLRSGIQSVVSDRLKDYTDAQYGKGELRALIEGRAE